MEARAVLRVMDVLRSGGVRVAIGGGWGIDALLGEQTRADRDLDLPFAVDHECRVITSLRQAGFSLHEDQRPVRFVMQDAAGREIDLHPVVFDATGAGVQAGFEGMLRYPADGCTTGHIHGQAVLCFSAALQVHFHSGYPPTARDVHDMRLLRDRLGLPLPPEYD